MSQTQERDDARTRTYTWADPSATFSALASSSGKEILAAMEPEEAYFWRTQSGAELDLLVVKDGHRIGFECKRSDAPRSTPSMKIALADLELEDLQIIYPGDRAYSLGDRLRTVPLRSLAS